MNGGRLDEIKRALRKLDKADRSLQSFKQKAGNIRRRELASIAKGLGMERSGTRNTEPYYESTLLDDASPIPIPDHSGTLGKGISIQIIKQLEAHSFLLREKLMDEKEQIDKQRSDIDHRYDKKN